MSEQKNKKIEPVLKHQRPVLNFIGPAAALYEECAFLAKGFAQVMFEHSDREK